MKIQSTDFRVPVGEQVDLEKWPTLVKPFCDSKHEYEELCIFAQDSASESALA